MKKEIRKIKDGIIQVTTADERWYIRETTDKTTGLPSYEFVPSVTWIAEHYPKGIGFYKWLAQKGWDEAEALKEAAADKGSKVHQAIDDLISGKEVNFDAKYLNKDTEEKEELKLEEYEAVLSFVEWVKDTQPKFLKHELVVFGDGYAGTIDLICEIKGEKYIVDFKTSQSIWPSHELQVSAYKHILENTNNTSNQKYRIAILQLGYRLNKKKYKFTELEDNFQEFLAAKVIWAKEQKGVEPKQKDYPLSVKL